MPLLYKQTKKKAFPIKETPTYMKKNFIIYLFVSAYNEDCITLLCRPAKKKRIPQKNKYPLKYTKH